MTLLELCMPFFADGFARNFVHEVLVESTDNFPALSA